MVNSLPPLLAQIYAELRQQGGTTSALMELHDAIQGVAAAVAGVAQEVDLARRGDKSTLSRRDLGCGAIERLVDEALHHDENGRALLLSDLVSAMTRRLQAVSPAARAYVKRIDHARQDQTGRVSNGIIPVQRASPSGIEVLRVPATPKRRKTQRSKRTKGGK